jgi:pilus assembly protein CpaE
MSARPNRHVLVAAANGELVAAVGGVLQTLRNLSLELARPEGGGLWTKASRAAAVILEVDARSNGAVTIVRRLAGSVREGRLIVAARSAGPEEVRALFRAGAADVITWPLSAEQIRASLTEALQGEAAGAQEPGAVISVIKGCGGAGATMLALNLAALMAQGDAKRRLPGRTTAILDLDLQFGDSDLALDLSPRGTVLDVLKAGDRVDPKFLEGVMCEHASGVKLLAPPPAVVPLEALNAQSAVELVDHAAAAFRRVVIDLPAAWADWTLPVLARSDLVVLVTPPTVAGAVGARRVLEAMRAAGLQPETLLVLNRVQGLLEGFEKSGRIGRNLDLKVAAALRNDPAAVKAADAGQLIGIAHPNAPLAKDLRAAVGKLEGRLESLRAAAAFAELAA